MSLYIWQDQFEGTFQTLVPQYEIEAYVYNKYKISRVQPVVKALLRLGCRATRVETARCLFKLKCDTEQKNMVMRRMEFQDEKDIQKGDTSYMCEVNGRGKERLDSKVEGEIWGSGVYLKIFKICRDSYV